MNKYALILVFLFIVIFTLNAYEEMPREHWLSFVDDTEARMFIDEVSDYYDIPVEFVIRLIFLESNFGVYTSRFESNGSVSAGWMQLNSYSFVYFEERYYSYGEIDGDFDPHNKFHNIQVGCAYFMNLFDRSGSWYVAAVGYNAGLRRFYDGNAPQSSKDYALFVVTGEAGDGWYIQAKKEEFDALGGE